MTEMQVTIPDDHKTGCQALDNSIGFVESFCDCGAYASALAAIVRSAQEILAEHLVPGGPGEKHTIGKLLDLFDGPIVFKQAAETL